MKISHFCWTIFGNKITYWKSRLGVNENKPCQNGTGMGLVLSSTRSCRPISLALICLTTDQASMYYPWWCHQMETFSAVTGHLCGEFTGPGEFPAQRPVTRIFRVFFDLRPNKPLSKQSWGWWFEALSPPLWRHCNAFSKNQLVELRLTESQIDHHEKIPWKAKLKFQCFHPRTKELTLHEVPTLDEVSAKYVSLGFHFLGNHNFSLHFPQSLVIWITWSWKQVTLTPCVPNLIKDKIPFCLQWSLWMKCISAQ